MVTAAGQAKVLDFGLARILVLESPDFRGHRPTRADEKRGTARPGRAIPALSGRGVIVLATILALAALVRMRRRGAGSATTA